MKCHHIVVVLTAALMLAACGGEDSASSPPTNQPSVNEPPPAPANRAPTISGSAPANATAGTGYSFQPSASDADGDALAFTIQGRPAWATFDSATGTLSGTPAADDVGTHEGIAITVSDGSASATMPTFTITVAAATPGVPANRQPVISGAARAQATVGVAYSFQPSGSDPDGDALTYSVRNRPTWASFDDANGRLSGTPAAGDVGTHSNIAISVTDGIVTVTLPAFSIEVVAQSTGQATISWLAPTENTDGTALTDLAGYKVHYGQEADDLDRTKTIEGIAVTTTTIENLAAGTWYFAMTSYNRNDVESPQSETVSKSIR